MVMRNGHLLDGVIRLWQRYCKRENDVGMTADWQQLCLRLRHQSLNNSRRNCCIYNIIPLSACCSISIFWQAWWKLGKWLQCSWNFCKWILVSSTKLIFCLNNRNVCQFWKYMKWGRWPYVLICYQIYQTRCCIFVCLQLISRPSKAAKSNSLNMTSVISWTSVTDALILGWSSSDLF